MANSSWLYFPKPNPGASLRLFCLPYAGGSALLFRSWARHIAPHVEVCAVQLPGHGDRVREPLCTRIDELVPALDEALRPFLDKPFAVFGYSLGAVTDFELARRLRKSGIKPMHLFVAGRRAPQLPAPRAPRHELSDEQFIAELKRLNGTPPEVFEHEELTQLMLPMLRADFTLDETYDYQEGPPLECPLSAYGGLEDPDVSSEQLDEWRSQTSAAFELIMFPGDHFFLNTSPAGLFEAINRRLPGPSQRQE